MNIGNGLGLSLITQFSTNALNGKTAAGSSTPAAESGDSSGSNLMAGNFVQSGSEPSKYIKSALTDFRVKSEIGSTMQGLVETYAAQAASQTSYASRNLAGMKAAKATEDLADQYVSEAEMARMAKERKDSEEAAVKKLEEQAAGNSPETATGAVTTETTAGSNAEAATSTDSPGNQAAEPTAAQTASSQPQGAGNAERPSTGMTTQSMAAPSEAPAATTSSGSTAGAPASIHIVV